MRPPTEKEAAVLADWLGGYPDDEPAEEPAPPPPTALIAALTAQTAALTELAAQVKALAERDPGEVAAAVALAVRDTLRVAGIVERTPQS